MNKEIQMNKEDYFKYYIQGSDHYLIPKDEFVELFDEMANWREESKQLKIQISAREENYRKLEDSWNELKKYIRETKLKEFEKSYGKRYGKIFTQAEIIVCNMILDIMKKLEQGSDCNE